MSTTQAQRLLFAQGPRITVENYEIPAPSNHQVLVRVTRSQVSAGSEMNFLRGGPAAYGLKGDRDAAMSIGYMSVGRISAVGSAVTGYTVGQRVVTGSQHTSHWLVNTADPMAILEPVPDGVSDDVAGFAILGDVSLHCVRRAALQIDQSAAIFGLGLVGQMALQFARISGAHPLIAVDLSDARLAKAKASGATHVINAGRENAVQRIREITSGAGADAVFHCTNVAAILQSLLEAAADRGKIILAGSAPGTAQISLQEDLLRREISIIGSYERGLPAAHPYWPWSRPRNRRVCLRLMATGELRLEPLLTHRIAPAEAQGLFGEMLRGSDSWLGIVIRWD